ncbi:MAG TPA: hypothetical protein VHY48_00495 [Acidobacteriaceae bacterium]|nr:hypothetical protein [Acidobacteriaceae bacterium]
MANGILAVALAVGLLAPGARAQNSANAGAAQTAPKSYRLVWTITDVDNGKTVGTQHYSMMVFTGLQTSMKMGSKIPVATGTYNGSSKDGMETQFQYLDVGLNINASVFDVSPGMASSRLRLTSKIEQSSAAVEDERTIAGVREPVVRQAVLEGSSLITPGKPLLLGSLDVPGSTHHLDVEVELEDVR